MQELRNPHSGRGTSKTHLSLDGRTVVKLYKNVEPWDMDRMLAIWRKAARLGIAPRILARSGSSVTYKFVAGTDLYEFARSHSKAHVKRVTAKVRQVLETLHEHGILFGDVNPGNVIVSNGGDNVTLIDWDTARSTDEDVKALQMFDVMLAAHAAAS